VSEYLNSAGTGYDSSFINHEILLAKLHIYGIQGVSEDWVRSYLTNKKQAV